MSNSNWLPDSLNQGDFTDTDILEQAAWTIFQRDFATAPDFRQEKVIVLTSPHKARSDRPHTYWHTVTEGEPEESRNTPIIDRLEKVPWIRPLIENENCPQSSVKVWSNSRGSSKHVCIWFNRVNYLIILKQMKTNYLLKTTYSPKSRRIQQLHREYSRWKKNGARLRTVP